MRRWMALVCLVAVGCGGCDDDGDDPDAGAVDAGVAGPVSARVDYEASDDLFGAPWPDVRLVSASGIDLSSFPNFRRAQIADELKAIVQEAEGFGVSSGIYVALTGALDPASLPDAHGSREADASVFLLDESGARVPVDVRYDAELGAFAPEHLLSITPLQGRPLDPDARYVAVVTTDVRAANGEPLGIGVGTAALVAGEDPPGLDAEDAAAHREALMRIEAAGVSLDRVAATALFDTDDPTRGMDEAAAQLAASPPPTLEADFTAAEVFDEFCVYQTTVLMPDFQGGEAPYSAEGGAWVYEGGELAVQRMARANLWVTVPRGAMPAEGFPTVVFVRTGGGGDRPLVDRGPRAEPGGESITPGTGPALPLARAGFAGVQVDGPLGGLRNTEGWDEQFQIFNINNIRGLRDNIRQSALELVHLARVLPTIAIDASACPDLTTPAMDGAVSLDTETVALMGHSMGATIAPLTMAIEPSYDALILSGAGASWTRNIIYKESPINVAPAAESLLRYPLGSLREPDPVLALLQWAGEPADPQVYAPRLTGDGAPHVLMFQGILDTYIPPPIANPLSLALELDLAGERLDETLTDERYTPLMEELDLAGGAQIALPTGANRGARVAVVVQHPEDGIEDGHEVMFQTTAPQLQYRCFLESLAADAPRVPASDATSCD